MSAASSSYKQTEVGVVPDEWNVSSLESFTSFISYGFTNPMPTSMSGVYMITAKDINFGSIQFDSARCTTVDAYNKLLTAKSRPEKNDLLLTKDGTLGRLALVDDKTVCINQSVALLRPNSKVEPNFLKLLLEAPTYQRRMIEDAGGSTIKHIYITIVNRMPVAIPSNKDEQRAIAAALSDVDALLTKLDQLIAKKCDLKQASMQQLLTGQTRLPGFSGAWEVKRLGGLGHAYGGLAGKTKEDFARGAARYIPFMNVMTDTVIDPDWLEQVDVAPNEAQNLAKKGDLFFNGSSETPEEVGFCSVLLEEIPNLYLNSFCFGFRFNADAKVNGLFFAYWFRCQEGRKAMSVLAQGATRYNIAKGAFLHLEIPLPSADEQTAIVTVLSGMDAELAALEARREKTRALKQGMMQELLTGRIRLI